MSDKKLLTVDEARTFLRENRYRYVERTARAAGFSTKARSAGKNRRQRGFCFCVTVSLPLLSDPDRGFDGMTSVTVDYATADKMVSDLLRVFGERGAGITMSVNDYSVMIGY